MGLIYLLATLVILSPLDGALLKYPSASNDDTESVSYPSISVYDNRYDHNTFIPNYDTQFLQNPPNSNYGTKYFQNPFISNYGTKYFPNSPIPNYGTKSFPNPPLSNYGTQYFPNPFISIYGSKSVPNPPISNYGSKSVPNSPISNYGSKSVPNSPTSIHSSKYVKNPFISIYETKFAQYPSTPIDNTTIVQFPLISIFVTKFFQNPPIQISNMNFPQPHWPPANFPSKLSTPTWSGERPTRRTHDPTNRSPAHNSSVCAHHECEIKRKNLSTTAPATQLPEMHRSTPPMPATIVTPGGFVQTSANDKMKLLPLEDCGTVTADRITNGNNASLGQFPWMALLGYKLDDGSLAFLCGGTLINRQYVLTAAHCVKEQEDRTLELVRLGEHNLDTEKDCNTVNITDDNITPEELAFYLKDIQCADPVLDLPVDAPIRHENFNPSTLKNDIALVRLRTPIDRNTDYIRPICLPFGLNVTEIVKKYQVAGWGQTQYNSVASPILQTASIFSMPLEECDFRQAHEVRPLDSTQFCVGVDQGMDVCKGDSGGPLMESTAGRSQSIAQTYQIGIVSFGPVDCGSSYVPSVYTKVTAYLDWILNNIQP